MSRRRPSLNPTKPLKFRKNEFNKLKKIISENPQEFRHDFLVWLASNPHLWRLYDRHANDLVKYCHRERYSIRAITHKIRWDSLFEEKESLFKINNIYTPSIARLLMRAYPKKMKNVFDTRKQPRNSKSSGNVWH